MSSLDIPRALLRKASHHLKDAHTLRTSGDIDGSANSYYQSMLVASEALLYYHGETIQQPLLIVEGMRTYLVDEGLFPEDAYSWLLDVHDMLDGEDGSSGITHGHLDDLEDQAEKYLITAENMLL
jgi:hypothetical protein